MSWWLRHIGWWPPLFGTGIKVTRLDRDLRAIDVEMPLRPWNRNYMGVQFGGSLFALTDPFYMIMLATNLSSDGGRRLWFGTRRLRSSTKSQDWGGFGRSFG